MSFRRFLLIGATVVGGLNTLYGVSVVGNATTIFQQIAGWMMSGIGVLTIAVASGAIIIVDAIRLLPQAPVAPAPPPKEDRRNAFAKDYLRG